MFALRLHWELGFPRRPRRPDAVTGAMMPAKRSELEGEIFKAQIRTLYDQIPLVLTANIVNAGLVALVLAAYAGERRWWVFFGVQVVLSIARAVLWQQYRSRYASQSSADRWAAMAVAASALSGVTWGASVTLLLPDSIVEQTFLAFVIGGMSAGALISLSYHPPVFIAFVLPATLPLAGRFLEDGRATYTAMAGMTLLFAGILTVAAFSFSRSFANGMRLQVELRERSRELGEANTRLKREVVERKTAEDRLLQAQKAEAVGQLTGGIAHDFNNLLTAVIGNLELAERRGEGDARIMVLLRAAHMAAERGATLTQRLLAFARRQRLDPKPVDVLVTINEVVKLLQPTIGPTITLVIDAAPNPWRAKIDASQLELAILNLALNARDAMPKGGILRIRCEGRHAGDGYMPDLRPGDYVVVSVIDTGIGMDAATLARAFEPFFTTKEFGRGSGLGLPMVHGFAAQSGGAVHVQSSPGIGTTAELWLPRAGAPEAISVIADRTAITKRPAPARIVVCDDDEGVLAFVSTALRESGHAVWEAGSAAEALRLIETEHPIDLLIADYAMPEMSGAALIDQVRRRQPGIKFLLITGDPGALHSGGIAGIPLLAKPFKIAQLNERVGEALLGPTIAEVDS